jgi:hypothetical protein
MPRPLLSAITFARVTALEAAAVALHWTARSWGGDVGLELRRIADEMSERAERLKDGGP